MAHLAFRTHFLHIASVLLFNTLPLRLETNPINRPLIRNFVVWMFAGSAGLYGLAMLAAGGDPENLMMAGEYLIQFLAFLPLIWFLGKHFSGQIPIYFFFKGGYAPYRMINLLQIFLLILVITYGLEGLTSQIWPEAANREAIFVKGDPLTLKFFTFFFAVILVPLMEEVVFRGLILQRLMVRWNWKTALIGSSFCFGILHFENVLSASIFGIIMGILYLQTRNLWIPVLMHIANNLVVMIWLIFFPDIGRPDHLLWEYLSILFGLPLLYRILANSHEKGQLEQLPYEFHWKQQGRKENFVPYTKAPLEL